MLKVGTRPLLRIFFPNDIEKSNETAKAGTPYPRGVTAKDGISGATKKQVIDKQLYRRIVIPEMGLNYRECL
jgi:hypothetical protein